LKLLQDDFEIYVSRDGSFLPMWSNNVDNKLCVVILNQFNIL
jgi:hypothetical protein